MRRLGMTVAGFLAIFALSAIAAATASAALPEFSPASGTFEGSSSAASKLVAKTKGTIECSANTDKGEVKSAKEGVVTVDFTGCTVFGIVGAHSLGDKEGTILVHGTVLLCYISKSAKEVGFVVHPESVHIEVAGKLLTVIGWVIGKITPVNSKTTTFTTTFKQKGTETGVQEIKKCEGEREETLLTSEGAGAFEESAEVTEQSAKFAAAHEIIA